MTASIIIISISVSVIATLFYNLYLSGSGIKRNVIATDYAINILETVESTDYSLVTFEGNTGTTESLKAKLDNLLDPNSKYNSIVNNNVYTITINGYNIEVSIEKYSDRFNNTSDKKEDYIKIITVNISYNLGKEKDNQTNTENLEIKTLKTIV